MLEDLDRVLAHVVSTVKNRSAHVFSNVKLCSLYRKPTMFYTCNEVKVRQRNI